MLSDIKIKKLLELKYFQGLPQKQIALKLDSHENTISRYCTYFKKNLSDEAKSLLNQYTSTHDDAEHFMNQYYPTYVQPLVNELNGRSKRKLTTDVVQSILSLSNEIDSTSPTELYHCIHNYPEDYPDLLDISMASIRRGLKML